MLDHYGEWYVDRIQRKQYRYQSDLSRCCSVVVVVNFKHIYHTRFYSFLLANICSKSAIKKFELDNRLCSIVFIFNFKQAFTNMAVLIADCEPTFIC